MTAFFPLPYNDNQKSTANHNSDDGDSRVRGTLQRFGDGVSPKAVCGSLKIPPELQAEPPQRSSRPCRFPPLQGARMLVRR